MTSHSAPRCTPLCSGLPKNERKRELGQVALTGGCGIFHLGFSLGSLFPFFIPNQVYDAKALHLAKRAPDQSGLRESLAIRTEGGQGPLRWAREWSPPQGPVTLALATHRTLPAPEPL